MKTSEIYYLQHKKNGNVVIVDKKNRFVQIIYLTAGIGRKRRLKKRRIIEFIYSGFYFKIQRKEVLRLLKKNNISLDLLSFDK
jgi:hypothetical protein